MIIPIDNATNLHWINTIPNKTLEAPATMTLDLSEHFYGSRLSYTILNDENSTIKYKVNNINDIEIALTSQAKQSYRLLETHKIESQRYYRLS